MGEIIGIWVAAGLTLCIFSFLYRDNPFYKLAEHLYVGSSAAYWLIYLYWFDVKPMLIDRFRTIVGPSKWILLIPTFLSICMLLRLVPKIGWVSRWAIAFTVGIGSGIGIVTGIHGYVLPQIRGTFLPLVVRGDVGESINNFILVIGVLTTLLYFYFSKEHKGRFKIPIHIAMTFIMVAFGAAFGYAVMARLSLLIGRIYFLLHNWLHLI